VCESNLPETVVTEIESFQKPAALNDQVLRNSCTMPQSIRVRLILSTTLPAVH